MALLRNQAIVIVLVFMTFLGCLPKDSPTIRTKEDERDGYTSEKDLSAIKVGYCTPTLDAPFYVALEAAVRRGVEGYGMHYFSTDGQADIAKQVVAVEDLLAKEIDVLILNPIDPKAMVPVVESATSRGVKVFIVDSFMEEGAPFVSAVIADNQRNGELLGQWLVNRYRMDLSMAIISGNQGNPVGREKRLGFLRGIADTQLHNSGKINFEVVAQGWGKWTKSDGLKAAEDILTAHPNINVLFAENDAMALGGYQALKEKGLEDQVVLLGFDGQKEALASLLEGQYGATAQNSPRILGDLVTETVARFFNDEPVKRIILSPSLLIDGTNAKEFYEPRAMF
ncbi:substrate-binding domain-containing protein [Flagellimonas sp.]|uniref:substrate-binding domain-containing protein n=1 Tax=Flagellimonas sp. TaxID=2058762 RepID=UPI003AB1F198